MLAEIGDETVKRVHTYPIKRRPKCPIFGPCHVSTCDRNAQIRNWCKRHASKFYKHGHVLAGYDKPGRPKVARFSVAMRGC